MGKGDWKEQIKIIINDRKFLNIVSIALVLAFILLAITSIGSSKKKPESQSSSEKVSAIQENSEDTKKSEELLDYEKVQKEEIKSILQKMHGVGNVEVMMYFESGEKKVPAVDSNGQISRTEETDNNGGKRVNNQQTDSSTVVMTGNGTENEPFILQTYKPEITGIFIVAEGAESSKVRYDIQTAVSNLYGISLDKVNVYPMKN